MCLTKSGYLFTALKFKARWASEPQAKPQKVKALLTKRQILSEASCFPWWSCKTDKHFFFFFFSPDVVVCSLSSQLAIHWGQLHVAALHPTPQGGGRMCQVFCPHTDERWWMKAAAAPVWCQVTCKQAGKGTHAKGCPNRLLFSWLPCALHFLTGLISQL